MADASGVTDTTCWIVADYSDLPGRLGDRENEAVGPFADMAALKAYAAVWGTGTGEAVTAPEAPASIVYSPEYMIAYQTARL